MTDVRAFKKIDSCLFFIVLIACYALSLPLLCMSLAAFSRRSHAQTTVNALIVYRLFVDNTHTKNDRKNNELQQTKKNSILLIEM